MSEGMFGGAFGKPVFDMFRTPPIVQPGMRSKDPTAPYGQPAQAGQPIQRFIQQPSPVMRRGAGGMIPADQDIARQMVQSQPKKKGGMFSGGGKGWDALAMISGTLRDLDGTMGNQNYAQTVQNIQGRRAQDEAKAKQAQQQAAMEQMLQGMTPEQRMAYQANPDAFGKAYSESLFREQKQPQGFTLSRGQQRFNSDGSLIAGVDPKAERPQDSYVVLTDDQKNQMGLNPTGTYQRNMQTGEVSVLGGVGQTINLNNNPFGAGEKSLADIPIGQPIPTEMLGGVKPDEGKMFVRADNPMGIKQVLIPGSEAERLSNSKSEAGEGREYGLSTLVRSYATLNKNKAITSQRNSAGQNIGALYSGTGLGKFQDAIGGDVGNTENTTARNTIQGLSMKALMDMISMSDVSAKAMDSDAEMKAWLSAIKDDNFEAAMSKLHALDVSFGGGDLMRKMFGEGVIDQETYQFVTNRTQADPQTVAMMKKMQRYAGLSGDVGADNLTADEQDELAQLRAWAAGEDIQ